MHSGGAAHAASPVSAFLPLSAKVRPDSYRGLWFAISQAFKTDNRSLEGG